MTSFVGFFISAAAVRRVGYPDPKLFIYGDDALYTLGLSAAGGRICFAADVRFEHDFSTFSNGDSGSGFGRCGRSITITAICCCFIGRRRAGCSGRCCC
ncbi:hypothetical protein [Phaeobacter inhibens]|uniref:hypothetical protein n=1 Tax=Phaeobacter inhibens TaxID=221822 RepID=UPI0021A2C1AE|nr:hypothetical protein [Phaeobacter inhibens]